VWGRLLLEVDGQAFEELFFELFDLMFDQGQVGEEELVEVFVGRLLGRCVAVESHAVVQRWVIE